MISMFLIAGTASFTACADDDGATNPPAEFIAGDADFAGYAGWTKVSGPISDPDPGGLLNGGAHEGTNPVMSRAIYVSNGSASRSNGQFANGTIFLKTMSDSSGRVLGIAAMAKRGGSFNASNKGWEWFLVNADGTIASRSDTLMGGICNTCHVASTLGDFVFTR